MSDVFWITRGELNSPVDELADTLRKGGIQPGWMQVIHWFGPHFPDSLLGSAPLVYHWPNYEGLCAYFLHDTCRAIFTDENQLVTLIESTNQGIVQTVLASPRAVGKYNLFPRAHLPLWCALPHASLGKAAQRIEKAGFDPALVRWLAGDAELLPMLTGQFPNAAMIETKHHGTIAQLNALINKIIELKAEFGLLARLAPGGSVLLTLVEL